MITTSVFISRNEYEAQYHKLYKPYNGELGPQSYENWELDDYFMVCLLLSTLFCNIAKYMSDIIIRNKKGINGK